ncbi:hypothetical protein MKX03_008154 [Papaver bracteatum]|nr:hypothetical protein MKX03_008154 [Papaver bracteatum]
MAKLNHVYGSDTALRNRQISFSTVGTASAAPGEQQQNFVNGGHHQSLCDYFAGHPFPASRKDELISGLASCVNDPEAENGVGNEANIINNQVDMTRNKTTLTSDQVDALERSFQEEIELEQQHPVGRTTELRKYRAKMEPERKVKMSMELGLHPRQVSIWFQNRRAKLKRKQLEQLYNVLQKDYEIISRKNEHLHQEVMELKDKLDSRQSMEDSIGYGEYGPLEQTESNNIGSNIAVLESTWASVAVQCLNDVEQRRTSTSNIEISGGDSYLFNDEAICPNKGWLTLAPAAQPCPNLQKIVLGVPLRPHPKLPSSTLSHSRKACSTS